MTPYATPDNVANEVRMMRTEHKGTLLIVEGDTDTRTYRNVVDQEKCRIVIAQGRPNAIGALEILDADGFRGVLAILDSDFSRLEGAVSLSRNALLTDLHDLECMMIASPAFTRVLDEFAMPGRVEEFEKRVRCNVALALARSASAIGYLRWLSLRGNLGLKFEGLSFGKFLNQDDLLVDPQELVKAVRDHSQRHDLKESDLLSGVESLGAPGHDPWQVSCGHDVLDILSFGLRRVLASRNQADVKREALERSLRLAYERSYFAQTGLYQNIRLWEEANSPYRVLPSAT